MTLQQPSQQLSQIEKSVTHLLIATKQLLETLTQWSRHTATEGEVSDVYVRLGYEFNIACRAFNGIGVDTSDLGPVPELLRAILEETLSQEASSASLDRFLPRIRDIIINLLHGLKRKQQRLRAKQVKENPTNGNSLGPSGSVGSLNGNLTQILQDTPSQRPVGKGLERRTGSGGTTLVGDTNGVTNGEYAREDEQINSSRYNSIPPARQNSGGSSDAVSGRSAQRISQRSIPTSRSDSTMSSSNSQSVSALSAVDPDTLFLQQNFLSTQPPSHRDNTSYLQPPPTPPKQQDALAALQRGGDLERRASRRYSAYQISKHLGASPNGLPLPPAQNTPIPNRGRDVRDSMNAVRTRGSGIYSQHRLSQRSPSPAKTHILSNRISEESSQSSGSRGAHGDERVEDGKILAQDAGKSPDSERPKMRATLSSPLDQLPTYPTTGDENQEGTEEQSSSKRNRKAEASQDRSNQVEEQFIPEDSPQPGKELTLFLQYKSKIKKFVLAEGANDLSIARLQLAFIEKFAWNTHNNGIDLPEIYIQDPVSGVRHELEDLRDVKDRCVLVLNVEALDEVKKHIDEGLLSIKTMVEGVRSAVNSQQVVLQRVSDKQQDTTREIVRMVPSPRTSDPPPSALARARLSGVNKRATADNLTSIQNLRQDLAVVRQTISSLVSDMNASISTVQASASSIKIMAIEGVMPDLDSSTGRAYVNAGKTNLADESERIVNNVDDLQDIVEDLRKDVVSRGVRPLPRQLESVSKSISGATSDLKKMQEFLRKEKPVWTKIWEKELELVCNDRDLLTLQEELAADLEDDLEKAAQTFALVEQATKQQNLQSREGNAVSLRSTSRGLAAIALDQVVDPRKAKDGVLGEVRALKPNHETRLEAIERAEKARQRELETRKEGEFTKEVATFVEEGKLKKSGGFEEAERLRTIKDEKNRREAWEKQQERAAAKGKEKEVKAEEGASPADPATSPADESVNDTEGSMEHATNGTETTSADTSGVLAERLPSDCKD